MNLLPNFIFSPFRIGGKLGEVKTHSWNKEAGANQKHRACFPWEISSSVRVTPTSTDNQVRSRSQVNSAVVRCVRCGTALRGESKRTIDSKRGDRERLKTCSIQFKIG
ncbi:hypothetical protein HYY75_06575 [bacterium]|nr:hypothetical protein [bacterium]